MMIEGWVDDWGARFVCWVRFLVFVFLVCLSLALYFCALHFFNPVSE